MKPLSKYWRNKKVKYRHWSVGAVECYERNCVCAGCPTYKLIGEQCMMKYAVMSLIENKIELPEGVKPKVAILDNEETELCEQITPSETEKSSKKSQEKSQPKSEKQRKGQTEIINKIQKKKKARETTMFDNDLNLEYPNYCAKLIDAIKKGYENYSDLEKDSGIKRHTLSVYFDSLFALFEGKGFVYKSGKSKRQSVCDFIQSRLLDTEYKENPAAIQPPKEKEKAKPKTKPKAKPVIEGNTQTPEINSAVQRPEQPTEPEPIEWQKLNKRTESIMIEDFKTTITSILDKIDGKLHQSQQLLNAKSELLDDIYKEFNNAGLLRR